MRTSKHPERAREVATRHAIPKVYDTYQQLLDEVARFAGALAAQGVQKGDRVIIYMPMVPETAVAMFACARIGAIHSVIFGGGGHWQHRG